MSSLAQSVFSAFHAAVVNESFYPRVQLPLPRKIARASGGTLDGFARALRVPELVAAQFKPKPPHPAAP